MLTSCRTGPQGWGDWGFRAAQRGSRRQELWGKAEGRGRVGGREEVPRSLSLPPSCLLLAPVFDHLQSEQVYSGHKGQPSGRRWPRRMEILGVWKQRKTSIKVRCDPRWEFCT